MVFDITHCSQAMTSAVYGNNPWKTAHRSIYWGGGTLRSLNIKIDTLPIPYTAFKMRGLNSKASLVTTEFHLHCSGFNGLFLYSKNITLILYYRYDGKRLCELNINVVLTSSPCSVIYQYDKTQL